MIILVEGLDNCGKSTLIDNIRKNYKTKFFHQLHYSGNKNFNLKSSRAYYLDMGEIISNALYNNINLIFDRAHLGEYVYSPKYRNYSGEHVFSTVEEYHSLDDEIDLFLIVLYDSNLEKLESRDDGLSFSTEVEDKKYEIAKFKEAYNKSIIQHKILIDINDYDEEELESFVLKFLEVNCL